MYAKITNDHLFDGTIITNDRTGKVLLEGEPVDKLYKVRLLDDDRELCYEAEADDEALEDLFDWAQRDVGVTILQCETASGWEDTIS